MEGKLQFHPRPTWLDMQTHIYIFENVQLDGSYVGDLRYWLVSCEFSQGCWRSLEFPIYLSVCLSRSLFAVLYSVTSSCLDVPGLSMLSPQFWESTRLPFPSPWPGNSLESVSWASCKSHLTWFPSLKDHHPLLYGIPYLENHLFVHSAHFIACFR